MKLYTFGFASVVLVLALTFVCGGGVRLANDAQSKLEQAKPLTAAEMVAQYEATH